MFNFINVLKIVRYYLPLGKGRVFHLNKRESPSPKDAFCEALLKLAQWLEKKSKIEKFTDGRTDSQTEGQTVYGRQVIRKAHLSLQFYLLR